MTMLLDAISMIPVVYNIKDRLMLLHVIYIDSRG